MIREKSTEADVKGLLLPSVVESKFINPHLKQEADKIKKITSAEAPHIETIRVPVIMVSRATRHKPDGERIVEEYFAPML